MSHPAPFPRRILLAVTGLAPQIVTETLYALAVQSEPAFIPTEIHLVTTKEGADKAEKDLLDEAQGHFHALCRDYNLPPIDFTRETIHIIGAAQGTPLTDIRTPADNAFAADALLEIVREFTNDPQCMLHVSIAGGRKTMGFYLGYCLSLLARPQDQLSHVLISAPFESHREFFYPPPTPRILGTHQQTTINTADAQITLADIPFVRMRDNLPKELLDRQSQFSKVVAAAQAAERQPSLIIDTRNKQITASGQVLKLNTRSFILLYWFASQRQAGMPPWHRPSKELADKKAGDDYIALYEKIYCKKNGDLEVVTATLKKGMDAQWFSTNRTRLKKDMVRELGVRGAAPYELIKIGQKKDNQYQLALAAEHIVIR